MYYLNINTDGFSEFNIYEKMLLIPQNQAKIKDSPKY